MISKLLYVDFKYRNILICYIYICIVLNIIFWVFILELLIILEIWNLLVLDVLLFMYVNCLLGFFELFMCVIEEDGIFFW